MNNQIPLFKVAVPKNIGASLQSVFDSGQITEGIYADEFEKKLSEFIKNPYTALVNSCTSAITLALRVCNVGPGDTVITTPMTCMATNEPIVTAGANIRWADIESDTGNISAESIRAILKKCAAKAVIGVHWAGQPFEYNDIQAVCDEFNVPLIADAAHALGASYHGKPISQCGDYVCFSFQAIKHLTTGDGGAISCTNKLSYEALKLLRWFGIDRQYPGSKWEQNITMAGYKFHMNNINAMIGLRQLENIDAIIAAHQKNAKFFDEQILWDDVRIKKLRRPANTISSSWIYSLIVDDINAFKKHMFAENIMTDAVHIRNDKYSVFKKFARDALPGVDKFCNGMINIPVGWWLSEDDLNRIVKAVNRYAKS
jgi:dTDP-4-amino-4,6-dideoxygalactose transaminase